MAEAARRDEAEGAPAGANESLDLGAVLAAAALVLSAFPVVAAGFSDRPGPYIVQTYLFWSDLPLIAVGLLRLPDLARRVLARRLDIGTALVVLVAALTVAWAAHPSLRGALQVLRFLGVAGAVVSTARGGPNVRRLLVGALAGFTAVQVVLATMQRTTGGPVGLQSIGEQSEPLVTIGGSGAPQGTMIHPYLLAGLAMVTIGVLAAVALRLPHRARACASLAGVAGVAIGLTYSRAAVVALAGLVAAILFAVRSRPTRRAALTVLAAVLIGSGATALVAGDGWIGRAQESSIGSNLTSGRGELADQALAIIRRHPLIGVGTGRYVLAVEEDVAVADRSTRLLQPVHAVPLLLLAEGGVVAAAAVGLLALALVRTALRAGPAGWALLVGYAPFLLLDHFPVTFPQGLVITAAWLTALELSSTARSEPAEADAARLVGS